MVTERRLQLLTSGYIFHFVYLCVQLTAHGHAAAGIVAVILIQFWINWQAIDAQNGS